MNPTDNVTPHSTTSTDLEYEGKNYGIVYSTYVPAIEYGQHSIWAKLEIVAENSKVVFFELYPNFLSAENLNLALSSIKDNPQNFIKE